MTQPNQNFRKAKRRLNRKHNRAFAFQQPVNGAKPPADRVRHMNSRDIMAATKPQSDEVFTDEAAAREHFGESLCADPACQIDMTDVRGMENQLRQYHEEDTVLHRKIRSMEADHATALRREEEAGYAKGLVDSRAEVERGHIIDAAMKTIKAHEARIRELEGELAECRSERQREHDLRVTIAGELESFKIRYQDEVNARVDVENDRDTLRTGFVSELRKAKAELATARIAVLALRGDER